MQSLLNESVLVLNRHWTAVHVTSARRALVLVFSEHARVVSEDFSTHDFGSWREFTRMSESVKKISTPGFQVLLPEVVMLTQFNRFPPRSVKFSRRNIYLRDNHTCQYCGCLPPKDELTIDHVIPRSRGGKSVWENVVLACMKCNMRKGNLLVNQAGMKLLSVPRKPHWLSCAQYNLRPAHQSSLWQKFIDSAYWNTSLHE